MFKPTATAGDAHLRSRQWEPRCLRLLAASAFSCRKVPFKKGAGSKLHALQLAPAPESSRVEQVLGSGDKLGVLCAHSCNPGLYTLHALQIDTCATIFQRTLLTKTPIQHHYEHR